jgi:hypothetical protein
VQDRALPAPIALIRAERLASPLQKLVSASMTSATNDRGYKERSVQWQIPVTCSVDILMMAEIGEEWLSNRSFCFGASSLANDILMQLQKEADGHYQSADYFSND